MHTIILWGKNPNPLSRISMFQFSKKNTKANNTNKYCKLKAQQQKT
jgi:hypothetical protein